MPLGWDISYMCWKTRRVTREWGALQNCFSCKTSLKPFYLETFLFFNICIDKHFILMLVHLIHLCMRHFLPRSNSIPSKNVKPRDLWPACSTEWGSDSNRVRTGFLTLWHLLQRHPRSPTGESARKLRHLNTPTYGVKRQSPTHSHPQDQVHCFRIGSRQRLVIQRPWFPFLLGDNT